MKVVDVVEFDAEVRRLNTKVHYCGSKPNKHIVRCRVKIGRQFKATAM